ncbi:MAG: SDR family oxidoreductase [Caldilineae bacterium]|nr:MAG: SDR family oxidoreductase [Caldilineae bacterium]
MDRKDLGDKVVIVTGASTGIGRATAVAFRRAGARVVVAARSRPQLESLAEQLGGPSVALAHALDVAEETQCRQLIEHTVAHFGGIDVLINNAGMVVSGRFEHLQPGDVERQFAVNLFGVVYCTRAALPYLKQSRGVVVNVSSVAGLIGTPTTGAYGASKAALNALGRALWAELQPYGVGVVTVCPYFTSGVQLAQKAIIRGGSPHRRETPARRAPGTQTAEQVAEIIVDAACRRPRLVVLSPFGRLVWRLDRLAPWLVDYLMQQVINGRLRSLLR